MTPDAEASALAELRLRLRREIAASGGVIPFARFMQRALYEPGLGYYERSPRPVGRRGDFYTSVSVGPVFGELLAWQFAEWFAQAQTEEAGVERLELVEAGAHDGQLAEDILGWFREWRPELAVQLRLRLIEPSSVRRAWQQAKLSAWPEAVDWLGGLDQLTPPPAGTVRILYSNELLDAFPVHQARWDARRRKWIEWGVGCQAGAFCWHPMSHTWPEAAAEIVRLNGLPADLLAVLPDGFTTELQPAATAWWREAARRLCRGWLLTLDYGLTAGEFLLPQRAGGTLRAYRSHRQGNDPLADPGAQDLTAHISLSALQAAGEAAGLVTVETASQQRWLMGVFQQVCGRESRFTPWTPERVREFQTLTHPEHLGTAFSALVQRHRGGEAREEIFPLAPKISTPKLRGL